MTHRPRLPLSGVLLLLALWYGVGCAAPPQEAAPAFDAEAERTAIAAVLDAQVVAWNEGDVIAFMDGYIRSDSLRFASGNSVRRGWQTTLERYQTTYPDRDAMGTLTFEDLEIEVLAPRWATVFGRFRLQRGGDYEDLTGLFTLLFEKRPEGWRVRYDHTSS